MSNNVEMTDRSYSKVAKTDDSRYDDPSPAYSNSPRDYDTDQLTSDRLNDDAYATNKIMDETLDVNGWDEEQSAKSTMAESAGSDMLTSVLTMFALLGVACLGALYGTIAGTVVGTNAILISQIKEELKTQVQSQAYSTLEEAGDYLVRVLSQYDETVISMTSSTINAALRTSPEWDQPWNVTNYYDDSRGLSALCQPTAFDAPRYPNESISTCASSAFVTGDDYTDMASWGGSNGPSLYINKTTVLDPFFINMYETNTDLYQVYAGFSSSPSFFRRYPGRAMQALYNGSSYDPVLRPWYSAATSQAGETVYTAPYQDYHTKDWMITGARTFYSYSAMSAIATSTSTPQGSLIGVVGADILLNTVTSVLNSVKFFDTGKLSLIRTDGQVVSDKDWNITTSTESFYYYNLTSPSVSLDVWNEILNVAAGERSIITHNGDSEQIYVSHLSSYDGQYILLVFVSTNEIFSPVADAIDELEAINVSVLSGLGIGLIVMFIVLLTFMFFLIRSIMKVFMAIEKNVEQLLRNVGKSDATLGEDLVEISTAASSELNELNTSMNTLITNLQSNRGNPVTVTVGNNGQQGPGLQDLWNMVPMATAIQDQSDAPPSPYSYTE